MKYFMPIILLLMLMGCDDGLNTLAKKPGLADLLPDQANVEINLGPSMLSLLGSMTEENKQISTIVQNLNMISVKVYDLDDIEDLKVDELKSRLEQISKWLKSQSYHSLASIKEDDSIVFIMALMQDKKMRGIEVYALQDEDELVILNIEGELLLKDLGDLMEHFDVDIDHLKL